ncbi:nucleotidyltransferase [Herbidospora galbida]|uniref:Nucleotidyltransferase n=1 Tax=Herbidospora galbida TaxID=2575442 RepID=A0A4V5UZQ1_9ACTN|nr:nucleotidyltransferase domain-containing protein [Herbidospora galbida]TKK89293.1 nucleotidyltransferase [Herbidospora galbida]
MTGWTRHSTPEFAAIAAEHSILRCEIGSRLHGTHLGDAGDRDELGICVEPPEYVIGLRPFEQYIHRSVPEGVRSGPGDLDLTVYSLRKWMRLALDGNPTVLLALFAPDATVTPLGAELLAEGPSFILSRRAADRFIGYLRAQRDRGRTPKAAGHMVRLGLQGAELLETGRITLPMPQREVIVAIRTGEIGRDEALAMAARLERRLAELAPVSVLPEHPDEARADAWLVDAYRRTWASNQVEETADARTVRAIR